MSDRAPSKLGPLWAQRVGWTLAKVYWNTEVRGKQRVPKKGPVIVVINHVGFIDGPVVFGVVPRRAYFLIRQSMFRGPLKPLLKGAAQIPVDDAGGRAALATGLAVLRRGDVVGVFPEGTRGAGTAESIHGGAAWLAVQSGAPIVPTALVGTRFTGESVNIWPRPRRRMLVEFGDPVTLEIPDTLKGRARQAFAAEAVAKALREHLARVLATTDLTLPGDDPLRRKVERDAQAQGTDLKGE